MITEDKITEIFCMADDFCKLFDAITAKYTLKPTGKRKYHRSSTMSKAEVMLIMILFHTSGYRCFKHFYLEKVCKHLRHLFPKYCCPVNFQTAQESFPKPFRIGLRAFFFKKQAP